MITSLRAGTNANQTYDVAIYGAGPAGITLARALSSTKIRVGVFEAGGVDRPAVGPEHPYVGKSRGLPYDLAATRLRYFGGSSNHWGGWCRPLDGYDFAPREHIPLSGWPISLEDLIPHYKDALEVCEVATAGLGLAAFDHDFGYERFLHHAVAELEVKNFLFSPPTRFGKRYWQDLFDAENLDCFLDGTLVGLKESEGAIDKALVMSSDGTMVPVSAAHHVLAMGAVENARILLHSGIANGSGFVGRCFSDHLGHTVGVALLDFGNRYMLHRARHEGGHVRILPHLSLSEDVMREYRLANFGIVIQRPGSVDLDVQGKGVRSQLEGLTDGTSVAFRVLVRMENTPNPESRIFLVDETDAYGLPRTAVNWQVNDYDFEYIDRLCEVMGGKIGLGGGRLRVDYNRERARRRPGSYQAHHMGTTRMSTYPENGVVDVNLRCHEVSNLYVAGSSVFPTFGFANPTLTIVALSLRLAQHLSGKEVVDGG